MPFWHKDYFELKPIDLKKKKKEEVYTLLAAVHACGILVHCRDLSRAVEGQSHWTAREGTKQQCPGRSSLPSLST